MVKIKSVIGRQVFDSRGNPTVEAQIYLNNDITASAISPSGASTGAFEAHELRDNEEKNFLGKGVKIAVKNINDKISNKLKWLDPNDQKNIDLLLQAYVKDDHKKLINYVKYLFFFFLI